MPVPEKGRQSFAHAGQKPGYYGVRQQPEVSCSGGRRRTPGATLDLLVLDVLARLCHEIEQLHSALAALSVTLPAAAPDETKALRRLARAGVQRGETPAVRRYSSRQATRAVLGRRLAIERCRWFTCPMNSHHDQADYTTRFEWGAEGLRHVASESDCVIIVDVLRFSTAVDVAVARGAMVFPYAFAEESASAFAERAGALLADGFPYSLSPISLSTIPPGARFVLPSPNGAALSLLAVKCGIPHVFAGCLRNANAVAGAVRQVGGTVTVIAAGERWSGPYGPLRPCFADLVGAGAIIAAFQQVTISPEAFVALAAFRSVSSTLAQQLAACGSGQELRQRGLQPDIVVAAELDASAVAPVLRAGAFGDFGPAGSVGL